MIWYRSYFLYYIIYKLFISYVISASIYYLNRFIHKIALSLKIVPLTDALLTELEGALYTPSPICVCVEFYLESHISMLLYVGCTQKSLNNARHNNEDGFWHVSMLIQYKCAARGTTTIYSWYMVTGSLSIAEWCLWIEVALVLYSEESEICAKEPSIGTYHNIYAHERWWCGAMGSREACEVGYVCCAY